MELEVLVDSEDIFAMHEDNQFIVSYVSGCPIEELSKMLNAARERNMVVRQHWWDADIERNVLIMSEMGTETEDDS